MAIRHILGGTVLLPPLTFLVPKEVFNSESVGEKSGSPGKRDSVARTIDFSCRSGGGRVAKSPPQKMLSDNHPDRIHVASNDHRLVANAGLLLPATLGRHLGLPQLVDRRLDLDRAPGRANTGDKVMTLVASALAGGDCIDDADALRAGGTAGAIGCVVKAPSTLGTFLFRS